VLSGPITVLTADPAVGMALLRWRLFATPEEIVQPPRHPAAEPRLRPEPAYAAQLEPTA
jgi:membrane glycosyltransferase